MSTNPWRWQRYIRGFSRRSGLFCPYEESPYDGEEGKQRRRKARRLETKDAIGELLGALLLLGLLFLVAFLYQVFR